MIKDYPHYSTDKRGFNVALLFMSILILLERGRFEEVIERIEALKSYRTRHLKKVNSYESAILLALLQKMVSCEFDSRALKKKSISLEKKLATSKPSPRELLEYVQILPPQWMWKRMRKALEATN
jgi:hypothetical protein